MNIVNLPTTDKHDLFKDYKFTPNPSLSNIRFSEDFKRITYLNYNNERSLVNLVANKPISNSFNHFYFEVDLVDDRWINMGFGSEQFPLNKVIGKTTADNSSFGLVFEKNREGETFISVFHRRNTLFQREVVIDGTLGIGVNILNRKLFVTNSGHLLIEKSLPSFSDFWPILVLKPGSDIKFRFSDFKFDVKHYLEKMTKPFFDFESQHLQKNINSFVKSYLLENGYTETLNKIEPYKKFKFNRKKIRFLTYFPKLKAKSSLTDKEKSLIRTELLKNNNWDFIFKFDKQIAEDKQLKANIVMVSFLEKFYKSNASDRLVLFKDYADRFRELKEEKIYTTEISLGNVIESFILQEKIDNYKWIVENENKRRIIGFMFLTHKNNTLSFVLKHMTKVMTRTAEHYGFESGINFDNHHLPFQVHPRFYPRRG